MNFADSNPLRPDDGGGFPLNADDTHRTETFGPIDNDTSQGIAAFEQARSFNAELRAGLKDRTLLEADPTGRSAHSPGAKLDAGKIRPGLVLGGFARALTAVSAVGTYGAVKYTPSGWISVPNGQERYDDAMLRHWLKDKIGEPVDPDTNLSHLAHNAWNALAILDLAIRKQEQVTK